MAEYSQFSWRGQLALQFKPLAGRTRIVARHHLGPLCVQRPFYPENNGTCHVYCIHPPGGMAGGDELSLNLELHPHARVLATTPAAGKFYACIQRGIVWRQHFRVAEHALLEWFPQENIFYTATKAQLFSRVELAANAHFLAWEITCLGRSRHHEQFNRGSLCQRFEIWREGRLLWKERNDFNGEDEVIHAPWGLRGQQVSGTFILTLPEAGFPEAVLSALTPPVTPAEEWFGMSQLDQFLVARYLGPSAEHAKQYFIGLWQILRPFYAGLSAVIPRIWQT